MPLETGEFITDLVITNPLGTDPKAQGDDHLRLLKKVLQQSFPAIDAEVLSTPDEINSWEARILAIEESPQIAELRRTCWATLTGAGAQSQSNLLGVTLTGTRTGVGIYTWDFSEDLPNANYNIAVSQDTGTFNLQVLATIGSKTVSGFSMQGRNVDNNDISDIGHQVLVTWEDVA